MENIDTQTMPLDWFFHWAETKGNDNYLHQPINGQWHTFSWKKTLSLATNLSMYLTKLGLKPGDKVAILSKNCAHWVITDLALQIGGYVSVPLYVDQSRDQLEFVIEHSEIKAIFIGKLDEQCWSRYQTVFPSSLIKIFFPRLGQSDCEKKPTDESCLHWDECTNEESRDRKEYKRFSPSSIWTILYTSGTSGTPKGVVHTYQGVSTLKPVLQKTFNFRPDERFFSYLPLAHAAERLLLEVNSFFFGIPIYFAESLDSFQSDLQASEPTLFFSVPRIWKKLQLGIIRKISAKKLSLMLSIPVVSRVIKKKIRAQLGLDKAKTIMSGAAPISPSTLQWFSKLDITILEGYGLSEVFAYGTINTNEHHRLGSIGSALPNSGFKLSADGEILFKSKMVMACYYKDETLTQEAFTEDGFFKTGDLGHVDDEGFVYIKGRTKEIFKTSKGEYVSPLRIENILNAENIFEQTCIIGSGYPQPIALVTVSQATNQSADLQTYATALTNVNMQLSNHEKIAKILIFPNEWTIENGIMTPTLKIKRNVLESLVNSQFAGFIEGNTQVSFLPTLAIEEI